MKSIIKLLLRLVQFICFDICRVQVERGWLLETDGDRRTMFRMGPVHARDNGPGLSGTEPERTARHRIYYMPEGLIIHPYRNRVSPFPTGYT